jgi:hypothetical protein
VIGGGSRETTVAVRNRNSDCATVWCWRIGDVVTEETNLAAERDPSAAFSCQSYSWAWWRCSTHLALATP